MSHSFTKLDLLLQSNGFIPKNIYTIDNYCVYIEISCISTTEIFLLYIPSKFNIKPDKYNTYKLKYVDIEKGDNIVEKYADEPDNYDIKNDYTGIDIDDIDKMDDLENNLTENYNREIMLKNLNKEDKDILKDIIRQLNRFKFCTQNIDYKLSILYKNYLCSIKRDDTIECYYINNYPIKIERNLYVSIDLKSFYKKIKNVNEDINIVKESIYKILNQNQIKNSRILADMLENKEKLLTYSDIIFKKKEYYQQYLKELQNMLKKLNSNEEELLNQKNSIKSQVTNYGIKGVHSDIQNSHNIFQIDTKLTKLYELRNELIIDIIKTRSEQENIVLEVDKILFDNSIMLNEIIKNFNSITQIIE